jgi:hypothetical protein
MYPSAESILRALSGGVFGLEQLEADLDGVQDFVRFQEQLWDIELTTFSPATVFSADWSGVTRSEEDPA